MRVNTKIVIEKVKIVEVVRSLMSTTQSLKPVAWGVGGMRCLRNAGVRPANGYYTTPMLGARTRDRLGE